MRARIGAPLAAAYSPLALIVVVGVLTLVIGAWDDSLDTPLLLGLVNIIIVIGLYAFIGTSGVLSVSHAGLVGVGAYVAGLLTIPATMKPTILPALPGFIADNTLGGFEATLIAVVVAAALGAVFSVFLMRMHGLAASVATLALLIIVETVLVNWKTISGTSGATSGVPVTLTPFSAFLGVAAVIVIVYAYQRSRWGLQLLATREDPIAARASGIRLERQRRIAYIISCGIAGLGGALYAQMIGVLNPGDYYLGLTFLIVSMLVVGGINSLSGAVYGTILISALTEAFRRIELDGHLGAVDLFKLRPGTGACIISALVLLILILRPAGLTGGREHRIPRPLAKLLQGEDAPPPVVEPEDVPVGS
jgi:branched-chain amino acid transport system permease protein